MLSAVGVSYSVQVIFVKHAHTTLMLYCDLPVPRPREINRFNVMAGPVYHIAGKRSPWICAVPAVSAKQRVCSICLFFGAGPPARLGFKVAVAKSASLGWQILPQ